MEKKTAKATIKGIPVSPQKLRLIVDLIRGKDVVRARGVLKFLNKKGSKIVLKALNSAIANAAEILKAKEEDLLISHISVDAVRITKKGKAAPRGRYVLIRKRKSTLNLELEVK
jgi:large subunit ribosomal protein L22